MADKKNTEVAPASEPAAAVQEAPVVVREKRNWATPLISALVVVVALVIGGIGGFAIARATGPGAHRPAIEQGQLPGGPGQQQGQQGGQQGQMPGGPQERPGEDSNTDGSETEEDGTAG